VATRQEVLASQKEISDRLSAQVRTLSISFLALVWLLLFPGKDGSSITPHTPSRTLLLTAGIAAILAMVTDFLQYVAGYIVVRQTLRTPFRSDNDPYEDQYTTFAWQSKTFLFVAKQVWLATSAVFLVAALVGALHGMFDSAQTIDIVEKAKKPPSTDANAPASAATAQPAAGCCAARADDDIAAIRKTLDAYVSAPTNIGTTPGARQMIVSGEGRFVNWHAWTMVGVCVLLAAGGIVLLALKGTTTKAIGASLLTIGALSGGGFALVKDLHIDSIFKVDIDKLLGELSVELRQMEIPGPERLGVVDHFLKGDDGTIESPTGKAIPAADSDAVTHVAEAWLTGRSQGKNAVLLVIGATDRLQIRRALGEQFDANVGLAQGRAEHIKEAIVDKCNALDRACDRREDQVIALVSGPRHTPPRTGSVSSNPLDGFPEDRRVEIWALWTRKLLADHK
jgi:hypothetical protein